MQLECLRRRFSAVTGHHKKYYCVDDHGRHVFLHVLPHSVADSVWPSEIQWIGEDILAIFELLTAINCEC